MKLVLKFNQDVKLYTNTLTYDEIVNFVCKEFNIVPESLHISFLDEDNDDITILSNDDIDVMQAVFEGKDYVKVNVTGEVNPLVKDEVVTEVVIPVIEQPKEEPAEIIEIAPVVEKVEQPVVVEEKNREEVKPSCEQKKQWGHHHHDDKMRAFQRVENYLNETVARLVDQRVKALIPCLKEQILNNEVKKVEPKGLIHEGVQCKGCLAKPIIGIRYECPTCPEFSLCQICEEKIDHEHNLLKIKKIVEKKEQNRQGLGHCLKKLFKHHGHGHHRGRSSSSSREKCHWKGPHWAMRKCWGLSIMFGGKPDDYRSFVEENCELRPRKTFKKYADLQGLSEEEFRERFIDMRCQKLSNSFGKPAQEYRSFVEQNYESRFRELVSKLQEKGEKSEGRKCRWGGKRFNFNEGEFPVKNQVEVKPQPEVKEEPKKEEPKKEEPKKEQNDSDFITDSMLELPKKESPEVIREKGAIFTQMRDIFGVEYSKEIYKFVDVHYKEGLEAIVQHWIEQVHFSKVSK